ncbi:thioredoxin domain-containing protein [Paenibacillus sp. GCM10012307]|uniref:Thioredoxin family protein n=1 Tax=Paenibacillus roseus TaxID=2798579 RepID=A0A934MP77_9BACL|nr:thioredoxin family protein [Paenibacillus roseus]MBJ6360608.1 thioredoxin family protein [Paenibacillus roseus]
MALPIQEITEQQLLAHMSAIPDTEAVLLYTPFCGTCKLAERMAGIVQETTAALPMYKLNINYAPVLREQWQIASVPCLAILDKDGLKLKEYALRSVDHIYRLLKKPVEEKGLS